MKKSIKHKNIISALTVFILCLLLLSGCMDAGAADWIGVKPSEPEETESEAPSTEESTETVGEVGGGDKEVENELPTFSFDDEEEIDEEIEEEDDEEEEEDDEEEVSDNSVSDNSSDESAETDDDGENHDVTKGSWDGTDWSAEATIGENYSIEVTVSSTKSAMKQEKVDKYSPVTEKKGDDINDVRFAYYKKYEDGDKEAAADDVEEFEDIDKMPHRQMDALLAVADDLGKLFAQFGITAWDFEHPAENYEDEVVLDVYRSNKYQYLMTLTFDDDHINRLTAIDFSLEE